MTVHRLIVLVLRSWRPHRVASALLCILFFSTSAEAQTVVSSYTKLLPIFSIYYFCLFRYRAFLKLYSYLSRRFDKQPTWLLWLYVMIFLAGLPSLITSTIEIIYPSRWGTMFMAGFQVGLGQRIFDACLYTGFSAVPGFIAFCYVEFIELTCVRMIYKLFPKLSGRFREAITYLLAAGMFFLIVVMGKISFQFLIK